jgi:pimeloyl-ACP methyl ester carboxylesterase
MSEEKSEAAGGEGGGEGPLGAGAGGEGAEGDPLLEKGLAPLPDGGHLFYEVRRGSEEGPPLLLHRPLGGTTTLWGPFRDALCGRFRVISFDPRGVGKSSDPGPLHTTEQMAEDAIALLDHLKIQKAHVFGLSLGGMASMRIALRAPERIQKLVLASTSDRGLDVSAGGARRALAFASCLAKPAERIEYCLTKRILSDRFREERKDEVARIVAIVRAEPMSRANLLKLVAAAGRHDVREEIHRVERPTLVLAAKDDPLLDVASQEALAGRIPGAAFDVISPSGHDLSLEQPVATAARVTAFLLEG